MHPRWCRISFINSINLPETNGSHLKLDGWKTIVFFLREDNLDGGFNMFLFFLMLTSILGEMIQFDKYLVMMRCLLSLLICVPMSGYVPFVSTTN